MIVFGFTYTTDRFHHEVDGATVSIVTGSGVYLSGNINELEMTKVPTESLAGGQRQEALGTLASNVVEDREGALDRDTTIGGTLLRLMLKDIDLPDDFESGGPEAWRALAVAFGQAYVAEEGLDADIDRFVERCEWAAPQTSVAGAESTGERHQLPGGGRYMTRFIDGVRTDIDVLRASRAKGMHVIQSGPAGTGKTTAAATAHGDELMIMACYEGMTAQDVFGQHVPVPDQPGAFMWVDGPLPVAMEKGRALLLDDFGWMPPGVQALLHPAMDHQRTITIAERPGQQTITATDGFAVILNVNPGLGFGITDPIRDRTAFDVEVTLDLKAAERLGVPKPFVEATRRLQSLAVGEGANGIRRWIPSMRQLLKARDLTEAFDERFAASALIGRCPEGEQRSKLRDLLGKELNVTFEGAGTLHSRGL